MNRKPNAGFTMIEMIVVVAIIGVITAIAYPSYQNYVLRARRADAHELLQRAAAAQERFYTNRNQYTADLTSNAGLNLGTTLSPTGYYSLAVVVPNDGQSFTLRATPQGVQAVDQCADITMNNVGARGYSGSATNGKCW